MAAQGQQRPAAALVPERVVTLQAGGLVERGKGVGVAAQGQQRPAAALVPERNPPVQADGLVERGKGVGVAV